MGLMVNSDLGCTQVRTMLLCFFSEAQYHAIRIRPYGSDLIFSEISSSTLENVHETTRVARKRLGEPGFMLPPSERFLKNVSEERMKTASDNIKWLKANPEIFSAIVNFHANFRYPGSS